MDYNPYKLVAERMNALMLAQQQNNFQWARTLITWLIIGNASALVFVLNLYSNGSDQIAQEALKLSATIFAVGLVLAFASASLGYFSSILMSNNLTKIVGWHDQATTSAFDLDRLRADGLEVPEDSAISKRLEEAVHKMSDAPKIIKRAWIYFSAVVIVAMLSALCFAIACLYPLAQ